jgi:hypothetical protein
VPRPRQVLTPKGVADKLSGYGHEGWIHCRGVFMLIKPGVLSAKPKPTHILKGYENVLGEHVHQLSAVDPKSAF